jgi:drug/metabolite transporter (DMT)-like permease
MPPVEPRHDAPSPGVRSVRTYTLLALTVLLNSSGNFLLSVGMKQVGEVRTWSIGPLLIVLARALTTGAILTGIASLVLFYILHLLLLSWADYSYVLPASASGYIVVPLLGHLFGGERVGAARWVGVLLVSIGVALVGRTPISTDLGTDRG